MSKNRRRNQKQNLPSSNLVVVDEPIVAHNNGDAIVIPLGETTKVVTTVPTAPTLRSITNVFTLEVALYAVVGIVAMLLRVGNLEARPLAPAEAQTAAAAWEFLNGQAVGAYTSPLLFTLNWLAFFLFGAFDLTARILPAALSTLLVFIPALARDALGKTGAFVAALLIAFSPTIVFFARNLSAVDLAVGAALSALILFWQYRESNHARALYTAAILAGLSLTADAAAFTILIGGGFYFAIALVILRREANENESVESNQPTNALQNPIVRATIFFAAAFILSATTFLLNRDGLGVAFNLLGEWFSAFSTLGNFVSPLNWLLVYEPLPLIFGLAALVLVLTLRGEQESSVKLLRLLTLVSLFSFLFYSFAGHKPPSVVVAVVLPLTLLAGWFIGNLIERAREDISTTGGARSMLSGEIPVFVMLMLLAALVYLQAATFLEKTQFSPALDALYKVLSLNTPEMSLTAATITLTLISILLLGVFIGLSILLVGMARTTTLLAFTILVILSLSMLRATWLLNFSEIEPLRELVAPSQTPLQIRDLVHDVEFYSLARHGDSHVIQVAADPALGAVGRWYLRDFSNITWTNQSATLETAEAVITAAGSPPPGDWMGQQYRVGTIWEPANFDGTALWKWFMFREGGSDSAQTTLLWLPTQE